jgi:hypothetical protein
MESSKVENSAWYGQWIDGTTILFYFLFFECLHLAYQRMTTSFYVSSLPKNAQIMLSSYSTFFI